MCQVAVAGVATCIIKPCVRSTLAGQDVTSRTVNAQVQYGELLGNELVGHGSIHRQGTLNGNRGVALREAADGRGVVVCGDVLPRTCDGQGIEEFEEIEIEEVEQTLRGAFFRFEAAPGIEGLLGAAENLVDAGLGLELGVHRFGLAFVGECQLVAQVIEAVVDRCCRKHQDFGLNAFLDDFAHEPLVAVFALAGWVVVPEVVGLVDDDQAVVAPVDRGEVPAVACALVAGEVGVEENVVPEPVFGQDIVLVVVAVGVPVGLELFGAQDEHVLVAHLVVLDDAQGAEGLTQAHAVGQDAAVVLLEFVDGADDRVALEVVELVPNDGVLEADLFIGQIVFVDLFQEVVEDVVKCDEVDELRCVFLVRV